MTRKIAVIALILILCAAMGASAFEQKSKTFPWMASYNANGQLNLYASVGYYFWLNISAGPEIIIANFDLAGIPLEFGVMARANLGLGYYAGFEWGVAGLASLHWGVDFGAPWKFDWYIAAGLGVATDWFYADNRIGLAFATFDGFIWQFSNNLGLLLDYGSIGNVYSWGIGLKVNL